MQKDDFDFDDGKWHWIRTQKASYSDQIRRPALYAPALPSALPHVDVLQNGSVVVDFSPLKCVTPSAQPRSWRRVELINYL